MTSLYRPRWPLLLALIAGVAVLVGVAYLPSKPAGEALPVAGGRYVEGVAGAPSDVNPLFASFNAVDQDLVSLVFAGLVRLGPNGAVEPGMADLPKITPDGLQYIFELQRGLSWHDGEPLDADDVLFTIETIQDPDFDGDSVLADLFRDVEVGAEDSHTVIMTLPQPFAPFLARGATVGILPEHLLRGQDAAAMRQAPFADSPIGSGPFRLVTLTPTEALLSPFDAYHLGKPFLEELELRFLRDDASLLNALRNDEVDGALFRPGLDIEQIAFIDDDERWVRRSLHATMYSLVYLNPEIEGLESSAVRRALQYGLDVPALIEQTQQSQGLVVDSPIVRDLWAHVGLEAAYSYDPDRAALFLDTEGWAAVEGGREKDGRPLAFTLAASDDVVQIQVAQEIARQWGELGITVEVEASGASQFVEGVLLPRAFDAALVSVEPGPDPDPYPLWHSTQSLGEGRNLASFSNPEVDELLENGRLTSSPAQRAEDYREFQEIYAREVPAVLVYAPTYQYVVRAELQGLSPGLLLTLSSRFEDIHRWFAEREALGDGDE